MDFPDRYLPFPDATPSVVPSSPGVGINITFIIPILKIHNIVLDPSQMDPTWPTDLRNQLSRLVENLNRRIEKKEKGAYNVVKKSEKMVHGVDERLVKYLKDQNHIYHYSDYSPRGENTGPLFLSIYITAEDMPESA